jgi:hypothetical protein
MRDLEKENSEGQKDLRWYKTEEEESFQNSSPISVSSHWVAKGIFIQTESTEREKI